MSGMNNVRMSRLAIHGSTVGKKVIERVTNSVTKSVTIDEAKV